MHVYINYTPTNNALGYIRLTPPDSKYIGQRFYIINRGILEIVLTSSSSGVFFGGGNSSSTGGLLKNLACEFVYIGLVISNLPTFLKMGNYNL